MISGAPKANAITLNGSQDLTVTLTPNDSNATHLVVYASTANGVRLNYVGTAAIGALPVTVTSVLETDTVCWTQYTPSSSSQGRRI